MFSLIVPWRTDHGHREELWNWNKERWRELYDCEIIEADSGDEVFSRAKSRNMAAAQAKYDELVIADADTIAHEDTMLDIIVGSGITHNNWFIPYGKERYYNLNKETTEELLKMNPSSVLREPKEGEWDHKITSWAGILIFPRDKFLQFGGYDERFVGWGWEDNAFQIKMDRKFRKHERWNGYVMHMWHERGEADFDTPHELANRKLFNREYRR